MLMPSWMWWMVPTVGRFERKDGLFESYDFGEGAGPKSWLSNDSRGGLLYYGVRFHPDGALDLLEL